MNIYLWESGLPDEPYLHFVAVVSAHSLSEAVERVIQKCTENDSTLLLDMDLRQWLADHATEYGPNEGIVFVSEIWS